MKDLKFSFSMLPVLFVIPAILYYCLVPAYSQSKSIAERDCALTEGAEIIWDLRIYRWVCCIPAGEGLEEAVYKMTGASADRFQIKDRGRLTKAGFADITVFDWQTVKDNNTAEITDNAPTGIEAVFINGKLVLAAGKVESSRLPGMVL